MALFLWIIVLAIIGFNMSPVSTTVCFFIGVFAGVMNHVKRKKDELEITIKVKKERRDYLKMKMEFWELQISTNDACISNLNYQLTLDGVSEISKEIKRGSIKDLEIDKELYQQKYDKLKAEYDELVAYLGEHDLQGN